MKIQPLRLHSSPSDSWLFGAWRLEHSESLNRTEAKFRSEKSMSEGETGVRMQRQVRDNASDLQTFLSEMAEWERDAREREGKIKGGEALAQNKQVR